MTGFRPSRAVMGAVKMEVKTPRIGGRPINAAMANPYGKAMREAMKPPKRSPLSEFHEYFGNRDFVILNKKRGGREVGPGRRVMELLSD
jgi:hypothetical protein